MGCSMKLTQKSFLDKEGHYRTRSMEGQKHFCSTEGFLSAFLPDSAALVYFRTETTTQRNVKLGVYMIGFDGNARSFFLSSFLLKTVCCCCLVLF